MPRRSRSRSPPRSRRSSRSPPRHRHRSEPRSFHRRRRSRSRSRSPPRYRRQNRRNRSRRTEIMPKKNRVPENWDDVAKMGTLIGTSRFLPLRVPLDEKYLPQFTDKRDEIWTPRDFLEAQGEQQFNVKMIIDLTNTFKYYSGDEEFKDSGVEYVKLKIEGFNGPPNGGDVAKFMDIVDDFVAKEPEGAIAVHCTHGLNRTGYLIVTYMVKRLGCTVTEALEAFKVARSPGLIKHMYVEDLYRRLGHGEEVQLPELPDWATAKYSARGNERKQGGHGKGHGRARGKHSKHKRFES